MEIKKTMRLRVSIHSWSSYQEKLSCFGFNKFPIHVSIHSWSSYQEKLSVKKEFVKILLFQSTPGLVTRRNDCRKAGL